jgi:hypothetical protein
VAPRLPGFLVRCAFSARCLWLSSDVHVVAHITDVAGWSLDLAVHTGLGRVFISDLERGKKALSAIG